MREARTLSVSIEKDWRELYDAIWRPEFFPNWASGLSQSSLRQDGGCWEAEGPDGKVWIRFTAHNSFGIMDHYVDTGRDQEIYVPLRVIPNEGGAEVLLTLFRLPDMSDEKFDADAEWVRRDLLALKNLMTP
jgi:hypothetical protein